jgi:hypothetical protein
VAVICTRVSLVLMLAAGQSQTKGTLAVSLLWKVLQLLALVHAARLNVTGFASEIAPVTYCALALLSVWDQPVTPEGEYNVTDGAVVSSMLEAEPIVLTAVVLYTRSTVYGPSALPLGSVKAVGTACVQVPLFWQYVVKPVDK